MIAEGYPLPPEIIGAISVVPGPCGLPLTGARPVVIALGKTFGFVPMQGPAC